MEERRITYKILKDGKTATIRFRITGNYYLNNIVSDKLSNIDKVTCGNTTYWPNRYLSKFTDTERV